METVPEQLQSKTPIKRTMPIVLALLGVVILIGISTAYNALTSGSRKREATKSALATRPATADPQQVTGFENQQALLAKNDAEQKQIQAAIAALKAQDQGIPAPESDSSMPMTPAQSAAIYGASANAPRQTSGVSEAQAQAKQKAAEREKKRLDALNSDALAVDFQPHATEHQSAETPSSSGPSTVANQTINDIADNHEEAAPKADSKDKEHPMAAYEFDQYGGKLYRVFEGTVLEGVVSNHVDGGMAGPVLIMLTTDYYSHDHQQLLLPQGTRLIGSVQAVNNSQQHKMAVIFHRAVCPDGFSLDLDKYAGLDQIGTTGLATKVDHGYLMAFAAAAAVGGLGGLAQIGNDGNALTTSSQLRNGLSSQTSQEGVQVLDRFLNRLPIITLKEGSRARVYIGKDILIPSYANHSVNPTL
ncbi:TrbI/VirB10 family protein [Tunturiibacter gelidoferens]|uniref:Type IV secretion system protein VirB10 n=1 Tax=Tunturiibacter lichenicola TaxID=2051959 RepID=A0A7Y9NSK2_9BACT|nr:TrbI/VirB10 family protein [Edaphobacter lichenicola]NYF54110.1 type IV secretion system protein VirB10 [Edaphobacter lichenicola]